MYTSLNKITDCTDLITVCMKCMKSLKGFAFNRDLILKSLAHLKKNKTNNEMKGLSIKWGTSVPVLWGGGGHTVVWITLILLGQDKNSIKEKASIQFLGSDFP